MSLIKKKKENRDVGESCRIKYRKAARENVTSNNMQKENWKMETERIAGPREKTAG
jgi:hypothetical protein